MIQEKILTDEQADFFKKTLEALPRESFFREPRNKRWGLIKLQPMSHRYEHPFDSWFPVEFDAEGNVLREDFTVQFLDYKNYDALVKTVMIALKWISEKMSWQGQTRKMSMSVMQHRNLLKGEKSIPLPWHRDDSDQTLVILLDDERNWEGGNFHFKENDHTQIATPKKGYGVLFSNDETQHCLESFTAIGDGVDRTILTIHEKS